MNDSSSTLLIEVNHVGKGSGLTRPHFSGQHVLEAPPRGIQPLVKAMQVLNDEHDQDPRDF
jgi:hypothetical protein